jgi:hypothetical protein
VGEWTVTRIERGQQAASLAFLRQFAALAGLSPGYFFQEPGEGREDWGEGWNEEERRGLAAADAVLRAHGLEGRVVLAAPGTAQQARHELLEEPERVLLRLFRRLDAARRTRVLEMVEDLATVAGQQTRSGTARGKDV